MVEPKIVITGTGRAGTTLLVQVLDELGFDTGLSGGKLSPYGPSVRAGLECRLDDPDAPTVVKDMTLGFRLRELLDQGEIPIRFVIVPDRQLDIAAASRIRAAGYGRLPFRRGALTGTLRATDQQHVLEEMRTEILSALDDHAIPHTLLEFPRFALDAAYTRATLAPILPSASVAEVEAALSRCVRRDMIHETPLTRRERWHTRATTVWMTWYRIPISKVRERINPDRQRAKMRASVERARQREAELAEVERRAGRLPRGTGGSIPEEPSGPT